LCLIIIQITALINWHILKIVIVFSRKSLFWQFPNEYSPTVNTGTAVLSVRNVLLLFLVRKVQKVLINILNVCPNAWRPFYINAGATLLPSNFITVFLEAKFAHFGILINGI